MTAMLKNMSRNKEFVRFVVANENVTCHLLKVLMMKCGYNKILLSIVKLMMVQMNTKKNLNNLQMTIMNYINKYGLLLNLFLVIVV